jgi:hypothetical protein
MYMATKKESLEIVKALQRDNLAAIEMYKNKEITYRFLLNRIQVNSNLALKKL